MKFSSKLLICLAAVGLLLAGPVTGKVFAVRASAAVEEPQARQANAQDKDEGKNVLAWGALIYGVGEVSAALSLGIAHARKVKRQEREEQKQHVSKSVPVLLYSENKKAVVSVK